jgi:WD40 repeat protein
MFLTLTLLTLFQPPADAHVDREGFPLPAEAIARVGSARFRFESYLAALAYTADGKGVIGVTGYDCTLYLWDAATGKVRQRTPLKVADKAVALLLAMVDGKMVHLLADGVYRVLDADTGKELRRHQLANAAKIVAAALAPDGSTLAVAEPDGTVRLIDPVRGAERLSCKIDSRVVGQMSFTADGKTLALTGRDGLIRLIDARTGDARGRLQAKVQRGLMNLAFSPDGKRLLTTEGDHAAVLWDVATGKECWRVTKESDGEILHCFAFTPDGKHVAIGGNTMEVGVYEAATGKEVRRFRTYRNCLCAAFSRDNRTLLTATNTAIGQWDVATGKLSAASSDPQFTLTVKGTIDGGKHLLVSGTGYTSHAWHTGQVIRRFAETPNALPMSATLSSDGGLMVYVADERRLVVMDTGTGKERHVLAGRWWADLFASSVFAPDARELVTADLGGDLQVWDVATGKPRRVLKGHTDMAWMLVVAPDGRSLATANDRDGLLVWDLEVGKLRHQLTTGRVLQVAFSPDAKRLAVPVMAQRQIPNAVLILDVGSGAVQQSLPCGDAYPTSVAFSRDGRILAAGRRGGDVCLWELATAKERHRFEGHRWAPDGIVYSADGSLLATSSQEAPAYVWDIYGKHARQAPPAPWSAAERQRAWQELAGPDAKAAFQAVRRLVRSPGPAVALLRERLKPAAAADAKQLGQWLRDLASDEFEVRQAAFAELEKLGDRIEGLLRHALATESALEANRRVQALLDKLDAPTAERLMRARALEALEQIGTPEAVRLLEALAAGDRGARLTREAAAVMARLSELRP